MSGPATDEADGADDEDEWRYSLEDLEDEDASAGDGGPDDADEEGGGAGVAGSFSPSETIEAGDIDPENALFVLVGVGIGLSIVAVYVLAFI